MSVEISYVQNLGEKLRKNLNKVIIGKDKPTTLTIIAFLCQGHLLIEDVPGVGKTMLARSLARSLGCSFKRIQFTPDMLPSDVTGVSIYNQNTKEFEFRPGPLMAQIVLADEINRATPKTQSALLEAMEERQMTVDGKTHILPVPFMVMATQNPIEYEGTFPLPEAQLDRFLMRISLGYTSLFNEMKILEQQKLVHPIGSSPRGSLGLYRAGQAKAALEGRKYVLPDDIKFLAPTILPHRVVISPAARLTDINATNTIREIIDTLPVPGGDLGGGGM